MVLRVTPMARPISASVIPATWRRTTAVRWRIGSWETSNHASPPGGGSRRSRPWATASRSASLPSRASW